MGRGANFIWDGDKKLFIGRSGRGWLEICFFFIIFFMVLICYFLGVISLFYAFVDIREPFLILDKGFLTSPGMGIRPLIPDYAETSFTTLIYWRVDDKSQDTIVRSLTEATNAREGQLNWKSCTKQDLPTKISACKVDVGDLTRECNAANKFGYSLGKPCVLLSLNKIYGWRPEPYEAGEVDAINHNQTQWFARQYYQNNANAPAIFFGCWGVDDVDQQNLGPDIEYNPNQAMEASMFPYYNQKNYVQPAVFVKFNSIIHNVAIAVHCRAFAKNLKFDTRTWEAGFHFELFFHNTTTD